MQTVKTTEKTNKQPNTKKLNFPPPPAAAKAWLSERGRILGSVRSKRKAASGAKNLNEWRRLYSREFKIWESKLTKTRWAQLERDRLEYQRSHYPIMMERYLKYAFGQETGLSPRVRPTIPPSGRG